MNNNREYYKCLKGGWSSFEKGKIYPKEFIGHWLIEYPKDFRKVLPYPSTQELIDAIEEQKNLTKILKALKQWK